MQKAARYVAEEILHDAIDWCETFGIDKNRIEIHHNDLVSRLIALFETFEHQCLNNKKFRDEELFYKKDRQAYEACIEKWFAEAIIKDDIKDNDEDFSILETLIDTKQPFEIVWNDSDVICHTYPIWILAERRMWVEPSFEKWGGFIHKLISFEFHFKL